MPVTVPVVGPLVGLHFSATPAVDYDTARTTDEGAYAAFFHALLAEGVALAPGAYEVAFPGLAHEDPVIDEHRRRGAPRRDHPHRDHPHPVALSPRSTTRRPPPEAVSGDLALRHRR